MVMGDFLPEGFVFKTELEELGQFSNAVARVRPLVRSKPISTCSSVALRP
jgi:hypothetical protein